LAAGRGLHRTAGAGRLFEAVGHLNAAVELLPTGDETRWLAELNLDAGRRAARVGAFPAAKEYLAMGLDLLDARAWRRWPALALELHLESARAEFATGNRERAWLLLEVASERAADPVGRGRLLGLRAGLRGMVEDRESAYRDGIEALAAFGARTGSQDPADWAAAGDEAIDRLCRRLADDADADAVAKRRASDDPAVTAASDVAADL